MGRVLLCCVLLLTSPPHACGEVTPFVLALESCIRNHARRLAQTFPLWGDKCGSVTSKVDVQAKIYVRREGLEACGFSLAL